MWPCILYFDKMARKYMFLLCCRQQQHDCKLPADCHITTYLWWLVTCLRAGWPDECPNLTCIQSVSTLNTSLLHVLPQLMNQSVWERSAEWEGCWERERERERETVRKKEGEQRPWEKKLSLVNQITLVTVCPGQTQQPNTLHFRTQRL